MNLVDSSGWLEYLSDGDQAGEFEAVLSDKDNLLVPTVCMYEVFKVVLRERGEGEALQAAALMTQGKIVELTPEIAMEAARLSFRRKIPMADSLILATGYASRATIWTMDSHFKNLDGVNIFPP